MIISQLREVLDIAPQVIYDQTPYIEANVESYYARNTTILKECDILYAFQVNESQ